MDLIDRAAARKSLGVSDEDIYCREMLDEQPTIPAVPLDKLCEWLGEHYGSPCQTIDDCTVENGPCGMDGVGQMQSVDCWHYLIRTQLLKEEQDERDEAD